MLAYFHVPGKTPRLSEDLKIWTRSSVIKSPYNWIMQIEIYSNALAFVGFNDLIIEVISSLLRKTLFNHISVFTNNEGSLQLFFKGVHWEAKKSSKIFAVSAIFGIISPVIRI